MPWQLHPQGDGRRLTLPAGTATFGSAPDCALRVAHPTISRHHARLRVDDSGAVWLEDLDSSNGTRVNGQACSSEVRLNAGDRLGFGHWQAELVRVAAEDARPAVKLHGPGRARGRERSREPEATLVAEGSSRFALHVLPGLLEYARRQPDTHRLAGRMLAALSEAFEELRFGVTGIRGEILAANHSGDGQPAHRVGSGGYRLSAYGDSNSAANARPAMALCASLLALASARGGGDTVAGPDTAETAPPAARPEPASVNRRMLSIYDQAERVARSDLSVLIHGETGTGKELMARFIHQASGRGGAFVAVNCAALPHDLLEAELFGIEARVATGVDPRPGKFVLANGGTLMLDEVAEMPEASQAKLLRALQEGEVVPVGARRPVTVDTRVVAATNRMASDSDSERSRLRSDLVHRLSGWAVQLPPLRERVEDIAQLAAHFLNRASRGAQRRPAGISQSALRAMQRYPWPGNVRELEMEISRAALFVEDDELLSPHHLSPAIGTAEGRDSLSDASQDAERQAIEAALAATGGNATRAAKDLGISRATLYRRMRALDIKR